MIYADTSFLASAYLKDTNTPAALGYVERHKPRLPFGFLHWPELAKVIFSHAEDPEPIWNDLKSDLTEGVRLYAPKLEAARVAKRAAGMMRNYCRHWPALRSLDVLHVSTALEIGAKTFLSFDTKSQRILARDQGLSVWPELSDAERAQLKTPGPTVARR